MYLDPRVLFYLYTVVSRRGSNSPNALPPSTGLIRTEGSRGTAPAGQIGERRWQGVMQVMQIMHADNAARCFYQSRPARPRARAPQQQSPHSRVPTAESPARRRSVLDPCPVSNRTENQDRRSTRGRCRRGGLGPARGNQESPQKQRFATPSSWRSSVSSTHPAGLPAETRHGVPPARDGDIRPCERRDGKEVVAMTTLRAYSAGCALSPGCSADGSLISSATRAHAGEA